MKAWMALTLVLLPATVAAQGLHGNFVSSDTTCAVDRIRLTADRLDMGHVQCTFTSRVPVRDMQAELRDAECLVEDIPEPTRYFIARHHGGVWIYSPHLGSEYLTECPGG